MGLRTRDALVAEGPSRRCVGSMMAVIVSTTGRMATGMTTGFCMAHGRRPWGRRVIETLLMAAKVVMFFVGVMIVKIGVIAAIAPGIRRVSIDRIAWVAVVVSAAISAIKASA